MSTARPIALQQSPRLPWAPATPSADDYPQVPLVLTALFSVWVLTWFLEAGKRIALLGAIRFEFVLGAFLIVAALMSIANRREGNASRLTKYICAYFFLLVLSLPFAQNFDVAWVTFVDRIFKFSCTALFIYAFVPNPYTLRIFIATLMLAFLKLGQEAFVGKITGSMVWENQGIMRLNGAVGTLFGHPNSLSGLAVSMLPFLLFLWPVAPRKWQKLGLAAGAVFAVNIIVFTGSRTGYMATLGFILMVLWRYRARVGRLIVIGLLAMVALPFLPVQYRERFESSFTGKEKEGASRAARIDLARDAWTLFLRHPLGVGIYGFRTSRVNELKGEDADTHNLYLQVLVDLGVPGLVCFGLLVAGTYSELRRTSRMLTHERSELAALLKRPDLPDGTRKEAARLDGDVEFMAITAMCFFYYLLLRFLLGLFGHDLYEVYWWIAAGSSIALANMTVFVSRQRARLVQAAGRSAA